MEFGLVRLVGWLVG